jgi:outer membrane autotransporter protein
LLPQIAIQSMDANETMLHNYVVNRRSIAGDAPATVPMSGDGTINMTLMGDLRQATYKAGADRPRATTDSRSVAFAVDFSPIPGAIVGLSLGIDGVDAQLDPRHPRITSFNTHIGPYASITRGNVYVDVSGAYNLSQYKLRRQIGFTGYSDRVVANQDGDGWQASGETGYMLKRGVVDIQPFVGVHYRYADVSGFHERGGISALDVARYRTQSLRSSLGARVSATVKRGGWAFRPTLQAEWRRELLKNPESRIEFRFANGDIPNTFTLSPSQLKKDAGYVTAGLTATRNSRTSFRLAYTGEYAGDRHINGFAATISRRF